MNNDLISRSELKSALENECFWCANRDEPCDKPCWHCINEKIDNAPTVPLPDFKAGYKQAILDGKLNYGGQVVPDALYGALHGWIYEDRQITLEEYMQSLKEKK